MTANQYDISVSLALSPYLATVLRVAFPVHTLEDWGSRGAIPFISLIEEEVIDRFIKGLERERFEVHAIHTSTVAAQVLAHVLDFADAEVFESYREEIDTSGSAAEQSIWSGMDADSRNRIVEEAGTIGRAAQEAWNELTRNDPR
jgi:hypothetical protein